MTRLRQLINNQPWLVLGVAMMLVVLLLMGAWFSYMYFRSVLLEEVEPEDPVVQVEEVVTDTPPVVAAPEILHADMQLYGYLFTSYSYNCRSGNFTDGFTRNLVLNLNFSTGTVTGGCHLTYKPVKSDPELDVRIDYDIEGTITPEGEITAKIIDGTIASLTSGHAKEMSWGLTGDFTGTTDFETQKAQGQYTMIIQKYMGGTGANPETETLQRVAGLTP